MLCLGVILLPGCAGYRPIISGPGYFGVGIYRDSRIKKDGLPPHIDLKGIGTLVMTDRMVIGYSEVSAVYRTVEMEDGRVALSRAEIAFGKAANLMAIEFIEEGFQNTTTVK